MARRAAPPPTDIDASETSPARDAPARDALERPLRDLRVSVTDRCNFRCGFCMPADRRYEFLPRREILTFEEITRFVGVALGEGVVKVRLTGGEPLLRSELDRLVARLADLDGLEDLALTTNGYLLADRAPLLADAGLGRVTVSFPSLDPETFARSNGLGLDLARVVAGIEAASAAGLPVKLNTVVVRGVNDHEIEALADWARERGHVLRFIEYMDVGTVNAWDPAEVISAAEIVERLDRLHPLEAVEATRRGEVARRYRYRDGGGEIGVIPSVTQPFCGDCTRLRLSADGRLYTCLFSAVGHDVKGVLRSGEDDDAVRRRLLAIWGGRTDRYSEERADALRTGRFVPSSKVEMFRIGG